MFNPIKAVLTTLAVVASVLFFSHKGNAYNPIKRGGTLIVIQDRNDSKTLVFDDCANFSGSKTLVILNEHGKTVVAHRFVGEIVTVGRSSLGVGYSLVLTQGTCSEQQQL